MNYSYDDIYGISLDEYVKRHGLTLEGLIEKTKVDIGILKENLKKTLEEKKPYPDSYIENVIFQTIRKKEAHLEHLLDWEIAGSSLK
jgi:hypothetical protein